MAGGTLRSARGCPTAFHQRPQIQFQPQPRTDHRPQPHQAPAPLARHRLETQEQIQQQRRPPSRPSTSTSATAPPPPPRMPRPRGRHFEQHQIRRAGVFPSGRRRSFFTTRNGWLCLARVTQYTPRPVKQHDLARAQTGADGPGPDGRRRGGRCPGARSGAGNFAGPAARDTWPRPCAGDAWPSPGRRR